MCYTPAGKGHVLCQLKGRRAMSEDFDFDGRLRLTDGPVQVNMFLRMRSSCKGRREGGLDWVVFVYSATTNGGGTCRAVNCYKQ